MLIFGIGFAYRFITFDVKLLLLVAVSYKKNLFIFFFIIFLKFFKIN